MANIDELAGGARVTRSLRKRLTSIDSDVSSRADTPTPKLITISETTDAPATGTPARVNSRRKSISTPVKSLKLAPIQTPEQSDVGSPARRMTRRMSVTVTDEEDNNHRNAQQTMAVKLKSTMDNIKTTTTAVNSPVRRSARSRSISITEEDNNVTARIIKQPQFEALDENDEDKESKVTSTTKKSPAAKAHSESKTHSPFEKYDQNSNKTESRRSGGSRSIRLNSDVEIINLDDTEMDEVTDKRTSKITTEMSTITVEDSPDEIEIETGDKNNIIKRSVKHNKETAVDSTDKMDCSSPTPLKNTTVEGKLTEFVLASKLKSSTDKVDSNSGTPLKNTPVEGKLKEFVLVSKLNQSTIEKFCGDGSEQTAANKSDLEQSKSVKFDNSNKEADMSKTTYPKTPKFIKSKSYIGTDADDSKETEENQSFESSEKSFLSAGSFKDAKTDLKSENQNTSKKSEAVSDTAINDQEHNKSSLITDKTPYKLKILNRHVQSSTPIVDSTTDMKKQLDIDDEQKLNNFSPDKCLRSGKIYGSSPTPPKSTSQCALNTSDSSNNSISKHPDQSKELDKSISKTPAKEAEIKSANISNSKTGQKTNVDTSMSKKDTNELEMKSKLHASSWSQGVSFNTVGKNMKIDEISTMCPRTDDSLQNTINENTESNVEKKARTPIQHNDSESDRDEEAEDNDSRNSLVVDEAEDAGMDYQSGDSMDLDERLENEVNEIHEDGESIGSEDSEEFGDGDNDDGDEDEENNSFIVTSDDESLLGYSDVDEHLEFKPKKIFKRIQRESSSEDDDIQENQQKSTSNANKSKEKTRSDSVDHALALEVSKMIGDVFSDTEFQSLTKSDESKIISEAKKRDSLSSKMENGNSNPSNNNTKPMKIASDSSSLNQSTLSESAMQLHVSPCSDGTEDEVQLNASRKKILNDLNKSERFNKTLDDVEAEEANECSEVSPETQNERTDTTTTTTSAKKTSPQKPTKSDRNKSLLSHSKEAIYTSSSGDENEPLISTSVLMQKRKLYKSSSSEDSDDEEESDDIGKKTKLQNSKNYNSFKDMIKNNDTINSSQIGKRKSLNALRADQFILNKTQQDESVSKESTKGNISAKKTRNSLNNSTKKESPLNASKKNLSLKKKADSDKNSSDSETDEEETTVLKKSLNVSKKDQSFKKKADSDKDSKSESEEDEEKEKSVSKKSLNVSKKDQSFRKKAYYEKDSESESEEDEEEEKEKSVLNKSASSDSKKDQSFKKLVDSDHDSDYEDNEVEEKSISKQSLNVSKKYESFKKNPDQNEDSEAEEEDKSRKSLNVSEKVQSLKKNTDSDKTSKTVEEEEREKSILNESKTRNHSNDKNMLNVICNTSQMEKKHKTRTSNATNVLGEEDPDSDIAEAKNATDDEKESNMTKSIVKSATKNVSFAEIMETHSIKSRTRHLSLSFGPVEQKSPKPKVRNHNSFTIGVSVTRDENSTFLTSPNGEEFTKTDSNSNDSDEIDAEVDEEEDEGEELRFSTDEEEQLEKVAQLQKLNEINSDKKKQRKSLLLSMGNDSVTKKKKQRKASLPYGGELNPSQSFVENITEHKRELEEENEKRKKRLSKSYTDTIITTLNTHDVNTLLDSNANVSKHSKLSIEMINTLPTSTPQPKFSTKGDNSIQRILSRCDEMLAAANDAKLQSKRENTKKVKKSKKKDNKEREELSTRTHAASMEDIQNTTESTLSHSTITKKEKTKEAVEQALKASADILLKHNCKNKRKLVVKNDGEDNHSAKRLPTALLDAIAEENSGESPQPSKKMKKAVFAEEFEHDAFKSTTGYVQELPMTPAAKKKMRTIKLSTGLVSEELLTPKKKTQSNGFHESPITPRAGFKVRQILTAGQDVPPELHEMSRKAHRRKRKINEPLLTLPKPQWKRTQSGVFLEETLPHTVQKVGATEFMVSTLGGDIARTHKLKKMQLSTNAIPSVNASALDFKKNAMNYSNIPRESSRAVLQRKERANKHKYF